MKKIYKIILILIFILGVALRTYLYLKNRSLWMDESFLGTLVMDLTPIQLLTAFNHPSIPPQATNPGFLICVQFITKIFGVNEFTLRIIPFLASIASIFIFYKFTETFLRTGLSKLFAMFLFAINFQLLFFSQEFKPYCLDVLLTMLVILMFLNLNLEKTKDYLLKGIVLSCLIWFSHAAIIVTGACGIILFIKNIGSKTKQTILFFSPIAISASLFILSFVFKTFSHPIYQDAWSKGFIFNLNDLIKVINNAILWIFTPNTAIFIIISCILGFVLLIKEKRQNAIYLTLPILSTLGLAALKLYPFDERVILFLTPIFIILATKILDIKPKYTTILILLAFGNYFISYPKVILNPYNYSNEEMRPIVVTIKQYMQKDDAIYIPITSASQFFFYNRFYAAKPINVIVDNDSFNKTDSMTKLNSLKKGKKYWLISAPNKDWFKENNIVINNFAKNRCKIIKKSTFYHSFLYYVEIK